MKHLAAWLLLCSSVLAQTVTMPQSVPVSVGRLAAVPMTYDGESFDFIVPPELDAFREYTTDPKEVRLRVIGYQPGMFRIVAVSAKTVDGKAKLSPFASCVVIVGGTPVPPVPPGPTPPVPVPPDPPVPPPSVGPRGLTIIRETADSNPREAILYTSLRSGALADYLKSKNHSLQILDDDSVGSDGKPSPAVEAWKPIVSGMTLPVLVIYDPKTRNVLGKYTLPATSGEVIELVKKHGG